MSQNDYRRIAEDLKSGKPTKMPIMKMSDLGEILGWLKVLRVRAG